MAPSASARLCRLFPSPRWPPPSHLCCNLSQMGPQSAGASGGGDAAKRSTSHRHHLPDDAVKEATREGGRCRRREPMRAQRGVRVPPRVRAAVVGGVGAAGQPRRVRGCHAARLPQRLRAKMTRGAARSPTRGLSWWTFVPSSRTARRGTRGTARARRTPAPSSAARQGPARSRTSACSPTSARSPGPLCAPCRCRSRRVTADALPGPTTRRAKGYAMDSLSDYTNASSAIKGVTYLANLVGRQLYMKFHIHESPLIWLRSSTDDTSLLACSCESNRRPAPPTVSFSKINQVSRNEMEALFMLYEKVNRSINDDELIQLHCIGNSFTIRGYIQSTGGCGVLYFTNITELRRRLFYAI